jgi:hypothetical protein
MTTAAKQLKKMVKGLSTRQICEIYEDTNHNNDESIPTVRGALMDELEGRDQAAFDAWIDCENVEMMDRPVLFFCKDE